MEMPDLYAELGVEPSATVEVIISAFRRQVRELRPDTRVDARTAERFGQLRSAYETLRDPIRRAAYDQTYERTHRGPAESPHAPVPPWPPRRFVVVPGTTAPEPPLRAGPVRWEPYR
ncbi:J domain-containing protein [Streptomyces gelaticus]|uniref:J domain-containing protein n=1 Tax=Streptomyces gelaticus TaxID=285446 RepID=UPI0037A1423C